MTCCRRRGYNHRDRTPACTEAPPRGGAVAVVCSLTGVRPEGLVTDADMAPRATPRTPRGPAVVYFLSEASQECLTLRHQHSQTAVGTGENNAA